MHHALHLVGEAHRAIGFRTPDGPFQQIAEDRVGAINWVLQQRCREREPGNLVIKSNGRSQRLAVGRKFLWPLVCKLNIRRLPRGAAQVAQERMPDSHGGFIQLRSCRDLARWMAAPFEGQKKARLLDLVLTAILAVLLGGKNENRERCSFRRSVLSFRGKYRVRNPNDYFHLRACGTHRTELGRSRKASLL